MKILLLLTLGLGQEAPPAKGETVGETVGTPVGEAVGKPVGEPVGQPVNAVRVQGEQLVPPDPESLPPDLEQIVRAAFDQVCNKRNPAALDSLLNPSLRRNQNGTVLETIDPMRELAHLYAAFPSLSVELDTLLVDGNRVATQSTWTVQTDPSQSVAGFQVAIVAEFEGEAIVETWETWDTTLVEGLLSSKEAPKPAPSQRWWQR